MPSRRTAGSKTSRDGRLRRQLSWLLLVNLSGAELLPQTRAMLAAHTPVRLEWAGAVFPGTVAEVAVPPNAKLLSPGSPPLVVCVRVVVHEVAHVSIMCVWTHFALKRGDSGRRCPDRARDWSSLIALGGKNNPSRVARRARDRAHPSRTRLVVFRGGKNGP